jgi:NAD(P)-dependent dehydrogenase (short-subunit alcohol dehydrogenase family)
VVSPGDLFGLKGRVAIVTGGTGVLGSAMVRGLAGAGARLGILGRRAEPAEAIAAEIERAGGEAVALRADVLVRQDVERCRETILERWGGIHILVNAAGGNRPEGTLQDGGAVFDLTPEAWRTVLDLNFLGTALPTQVFGEAMARTGEGCIVNISSMAATRALTRVPVYSAAKAAVENFTRWLAVELARKYGPGLRVNAIAPGFFLAEQNRRLLTNEDGSLTARGRLIIEHTPAGRFGEPEELVGTLLWLCSPASRFVNGVVVPVDGGFLAYGGV